MKQHILGRLLRRDIHVDTWLLSGLEVHDGDE